MQWLVVWAILDLSDISSRPIHLSESLLHMNNSTIKRRKKSAACPGPHVCQTIDRSMHLLLKLIFLHSIQFGLSLSLLAAQQQTASQRFSSRLHFDPFLTTSTLNFLGLNWKICIENGPLRQCPPKYWTLFPVKLFFTLAGLGFQSWDFFSDQPHHTLVSLVSVENGASLECSYFNVQPARKLATELCQVINKWTYISNEKRTKILADNRTTSS